MSDITDEQHAAFEAMRVNGIKPTGKTERIDFDGVAFFFDGEGKFVLFTSPGNADALQSAWDRSAP